MQATEAEKKTRNDESINFRPSPNFKHMKKYLKSKFEEENSSPNSSSSTSASSTSAISTMPDVETSSSSQSANSTPAAGQPPLPPNPPPPDSPLIKQEIEDDYQCSTGGESPKLNLVEEPTSTEKPVTEPQETMCRNFIRGTCKKGAACIFAHKLILSQLPGVYTFCRNFQNRQCTYTKCKFVHASVFEKENFFRTGYLPPHTTAHLKPTVAAPQPQQPPPPPPIEETIPKVTPPTFANTSTTAFNTSVPPTTLLGCANPTVPEINVNNGIFNKQGIVGSTTTQLKREWNDNDEFNIVNRITSTVETASADSTEPPVKRCKNCDSNEFRYQYIKNKVETFILSSEERNQKMAVLNRKHQRLINVLTTLFCKPGGALSNSGFFTSAFGVGGEIEKAIREHLNVMLATNSRLSMGSDDMSFLKF